MILTNGVISAHCPIKSAAVICLAGMLLDASLAATSNNGSVTQNPNMRATPARMWSVGGVDKEVSGRHYA